MPRPFTTREWELLECIFEGNNVRSAAQKLGIELQTAKNMMSSMIRKSHIDSKKFDVVCRLVYLLALKRRLIPYLEPISRRPDPIE